MNVQEGMTSIMPVLPLRGLVIFPGMLIHFDVAREKSVNALYSAMGSDQHIFVVAQKDPAIDAPLKDDVFETGVVAKIVQLVKQPENMVRVVIEGQYRAEIKEYNADGEFISAIVEPVKYIKNKTTVMNLALVRSVRNVFEEYLKYMPKMPSDILYKSQNAKNADDFSDFIAANIQAGFESKQRILATKDVTERLEFILDFLTNEVYLLKIERELTDKARAKIDESQKEYMLREQLQIIKSELGEDEPDDEIREYEEKIRELKLPEEVETTLLKECAKLDKTPFMSQEAAVIRTYLDTCLELPWNVYSEDDIDLKRVAESLDKNHYGLKKVKERFLEYLAVKKNAPDMKGQIICLLGPPGVGKTSIAKSVAEAIGKKYARVALGGVRDEAEIRGHRRTYVGSMPGRIINAMKQAGTMNPLIVLDEIDKLASDYKGDPTSALLEVLDSEQNNTFTDHYIDLPFDLSDVMFVTTANDYSTIPAPLRDRMEVIELPSYTLVEKINIAKKHLIPKQLKNCGLNAKDFKFTPKAVEIIINNYTKEAGVRNLERTIASVMRKSVYKKLTEDIEKITISNKDLEELLGPAKYSDSEKSNKDEVGYVNGLAWTSVGGELLPIEIAVMQGTGKIELTGSLGDVMKESAKTAVTCIRSHADELNIDPMFYSTKDIHIHAPEGAVPKDGPSAGITMATALYSALSNKKVRHDVAMTGEITLRGKVLPIGGLNEKSMAAYKNGIKTVIIPKENSRDLAEIDEDVKNNVTFIPVSDIKEVLKIAVLDKTEKTPSGRKKTKKSLNASGIDESMKEVTL
ncbi:endopeptidase La [Anaeromassilibacillus sp. An172]|uniref:endopeptidase La n=1 Tax=Anaeromassilibacillus sp. An172 TaxID=1965570 RepID=UPI000B389F4F|nr:endopeptidase La [Anaeromassilibacillus sp. An172]OUP79574.1 endopeptidase La [Anaeromassilibacillus sp. An172]